MKAEQAMDSKNPADEMDRDGSFEAIFALNMGDFVAEHFISEDLLTKINQSVTTNPDKLRKQLEELVAIYSLDNTLSLLGFPLQRGRGVVRLTGHQLDGDDAGGCLSYFSDHV